VKKMVMKTSIKLLKLVRITSRTYPEIRTKSKKHNFIVAVQKSRNIRLKIAVLSGDGPEVILAKSVVRYGRLFTTTVVEDALVGTAAIDKTETSLPQQAVNLCLNTDAVLFGAVGNHTIIIRYIASLVY
jgi:hypothetical protein